MTTTKRTKSMTALLRQLRQMGACSEGIALVRQHATPEAWWAASERGDHMLWLAARAGVRRQDVVLAACACARLALPYVTPGETRPLRAIETAERWARGEPGATLDDVRTAAAAAYAAANAVAYAAAAAYHVAYAANAVAYTAAAAYYAAYAANARSSAPRRCADLVRERIPWTTVEHALSEREEG